jgi:hypothetical protein
MEDVTGGRQHFHNEELHNVYTSQNIIKGKVKVKSKFVPVFLFLTQHLAMEA